ncbi:phosphatase PAP2 family protein [Paenibacillus sp. 1011MAR3C5]|uniref:phosphatase PAP2 family protein n=1 Tax=Paenibacillus sp. 1011MAR3C5 TaxID=1675787 RepID=UPI000E6C4F95|nr:phosphatase PAP2 family protein [Paenibacillus sp. 1011MAR3C5]RJE90119.1 phosphatase PAP2 family protein [Paenibacillus sp. 1011MAR3C5]
MEAVFIRKERSFWIIMLVIGIIGFAIAAITVPDNGGHAFDQWAHDGLTEWRSEGLTSFLKWMSVLGSTAVIVAITLLAAAWFGYRHGWRYSGMLIGSVLAGYLLNTLLKNLFGRVRPGSAWELTADGASFPSGNAMLGMVMFGMIIVILLKESRWSGWLKSVISVLVALLIVLMGASRIYFHVHYISDVLAGYSAGLIVISAALLLAGIRGRKKGAYS